MILVSRGVCKKDLARFGVASDDHTVLLVDTLARNESERSDEAVALPIDSLVIIHTGAFEDIPRLVRLASALGYLTIRKAIGDCLDRLWASTRDVVFVVQVATGGIGGWLHGAHQELLESGEQCEIFGLVVGEDHRRCGMGRALIAAVEVWARRQGITSMAVRRGVTRVESHPFYERLGYVRVKTQHVYRKPLEP